MGIKVKLDEDLSPMVAGPMQAAGYEVYGVVEQGWGGAKDDELWPGVVAEGAFFVTGDKGFGDVRSYPPGTHPGILLLRPDRESIVDYRALIETVVRDHSLGDLTGAIAVATPRGIRIRRPPKTDPDREPI